MRLVVRIELLRAVGVAVAQLSVQRALALHAPACLVLGRLQVGLLGRLLRLQGLQTLVLGPHCLVQVANLFVLLGDLLIKLAHLVKRLGFRRAGKLPELGELLGHRAPRLDRVQQRREEQHPGDGAMKRRDPGDEAPFRLPGEGRKAGKEGGSEGARERSVEQPVEDSSASHGARRDQSPIVTPVRRRRGRRAALPSLGERERERFFRFERIRTISRKTHLYRPRGSSPSIEP